MKYLLSSLMLYVAMTAMAAVTGTLSSSNEMTMANEFLNVTIGSNGRVSTMNAKKMGVSLNILSSSGIYFDYTADANTGLNPNRAEIVKQNDDYIEVVYINDQSDLHVEQGYIMRTGVAGIYTYVVIRGTATSSSVNLREARVCVRTAANMTNGYVDEVMRGKIPTISEMTEAEKTENTVQDATYYLADGSVYTKYNWAQYIVNDDFHGLTSTKIGLWNIPVSYEWLNGGPMRQELTVHATSKSPITIQMLQGEHFGAAAQPYNQGEEKIYGPFLIYANVGSADEMIADARRMAQQQKQEWPYEWFEHPLYPHDRATVTGKINVTTGQTAEGIQVVLCEPGSDPYLQGKKYMFWGKTDANGEFEIPNVRKGDYAIYAYATKGDVTDALQVNDIAVNDAQTDLGVIDWTPGCYEHLLWMIGENNRLSDGYKLSDQPRDYGHKDLTAANLTFTIGESNPAEDLWYAQTKNGTWTIKFNLDQDYTGDAYLTASLAGTTNKPTVTVAVNGTTVGTWSNPTNDAAIYRSAVLGGRHSVKQSKFNASLLKKGENTVTLRMSGISKNGGVMYDCIKLETGEKVENASLDLIQSDDSGAPVEYFNLQGVKVPNPSPGLYIRRCGTKTDKVIL